MAADEIIHNSGSTTTGTITTLEGKVPSRRRRKIDVAGATSPQKMAIPAGRNFASCYMELCKQQRLRPLPVIRVTLPHRLNFITDRVKMDDWKPILNSLSLDRSLKSISLHSRYQCRKPLEEVNSEDKARAMGKAPVVLTRYILEWLSQSVNQCVRNSTNLTHLELDGIPLPPDCIAVLCVGLASTQTLSHLSLRRCYIGDKGCELICRVIADARSVKSLNLSHCNLTSSSGGTLATAISRQKSSLYHDTWKQSLRYREPNYKAMRGLRRLTLNDNPQLGNCTARELFEELRDDNLWLKALDLQHCGLTDQIEQELLELLDQNNTLVVLDVRRNFNLNESLATEVMRRLEEKDAEGKSEYRWIRVQTKDQRTATTSSIGTRRGENEHGGKSAYHLAVERRATFPRYPRKPPQVIHPRRTAPISALPRRMKTRPQSPPVHDVTARREDPQPRDTVRLMPKFSLHLDLQSHLQPETVNSSNRDKLAENRSQNESVSKRFEKASPGSSDSTKRNVVVPSADLEESDESKSTLRRVTETETEHDRLSEGSKRVDLLLAEERSRREAAESHMAELKIALQRKENETRDFLLVSHQSFDEICLSFKRLLEMMESVNANLTARTQTSQQMAQADIEQRLESVIRQTKSENLKRGYKEKLETSRYAVDTGRKFAKSESDVRSKPPIAAIQLERKIGECPEEGSGSHRRRHDDVIDKSMSSVERARAIFKRILTRESVLDYC